MPALAPLKDPLRPCPCLEGLSPQRQRDRMVSDLIELALSPSNSVRGAIPVVARCHLRLSTASLAAAQAAMVSASQLDVAKMRWRLERQERAVPLCVTT